jgi:hypothetical protein
MIKMMLAALALCVLTGCGPNMEYWCHPTKNSVEAFPKEQYECQHDAYLRASLRKKKGDDDVIREEWVACMKSRGWLICEGPKKEDFKEVQP